MTINYMNDVSNGQGVLVFFKVLSRWKGSLYKLVWADLLLYLFIYYALNLSYRFLMNDDQQRYFEAIVLYCERMKKDIPLFLLLGFFVSGILARWFQNFYYVILMDDIALSISVAVNCKDEEACRQIRLTVMRYLNLGWVLLMRIISEQIHARFAAYEEEEIKQQIKSGKAKQTTKICANARQPWCFEDGTVLTRRSRLRTVSGSTANSASNPTNIAMRPRMRFSTRENGRNSAYDNIDVENEVFEDEQDTCLSNLLRSFNKDKEVQRTFGKLITEPEIRAFQNIARSFSVRTNKVYAPEYWVPLQWAQRLLHNAELSGYIPHQKTTYFLNNEIGRLRSKMQRLHLYSSMLIPLVYTQVVTIAVYSYFLCQLFACQFVKNHGPGDVHNVDFYVPVFNILLFLFLMGWMRVAVCVMNPFGDDDVDFPTSNILNYNLEMSRRVTLQRKETSPEHLHLPMMSSAKTATEIGQVDSFLSDTWNEVTTAMMKDSSQYVNNLEMPRSTFSFCTRCCD